ncbi:hypothetical protein M758_11G116500 [Ceratodon purpureus]|nr:hypothetical protein M758_11G116500 [Ceratodon purpureus]
MANKSSITMHPLTMALVMTLVMALTVQETQAKCPTNDLTYCLEAAEADVQPSHKCCTNLAAYTKTATPAVCLCEAALSSTFVDDDNLILQYALQIPQKCNLRYPAGTTCMGFAFPGGQ